ncbi:ABC transporter permease [Chloroflexota bacterium]
MTRPIRVAGLLAYTSITRGNKGVILLTILILSLVSMNLIFVPSLLDGLVSGANDKLVNTYVGNLIVEPAADKDYIRDVDDLILRIEDINGVTAVSARNSIGAELEYNEGQTSCSIHGIVPEREKEVLNVHEWLIEGSYLESKDRDMILLGLQIAGADRPEIEFYTRSLKSVHAGDRVSVRFVNGKEKVYTVKGIFSTEFIQTDLQAFVTETEFRSISALARGNASSIHIKLDEKADVNRVMDEIVRIRDDIKVLSWVEYAGIVRSMTDSFTVINAILNIVNLLVAGITVFIVTYIEVSNRRRQIGIQRAIGIAPFSITVSYLIRAVFYAIIGVVLAILLFINVIMPLEARYPFHFPFGDVFLVVGPLDMVRTGVIVLAVTIIASLLPVRGIIRMKIINAIWSS